MEKKTSFPTIMKGTAVVTFAATVVLVLLHHLTSQGRILSAAISTGTTFITSPCG